MKVLCKTCNKFIEPLDGYYYKKCPICYNPLPRKSIDWLMFMVVILGIATFITLALASASNVTITPFSTNPANGSTVNTRYVNLGWNITTLNPLNSIIFNWNNTNYSLYDDSLVLYYNFDNRSALGESDTVVKDISRYGNNATVIGGSNITWTSNGKYGGAFDFSGNVNSISNNNINICYNSSCDFAFGFWIKHNTQGAYSSILSANVDASNKIWDIIAETNNKVSFKYWNTTAATYTTSNVILSTNYTYVFINVKRTSNNLSIYVNGNLSQSFDISHLNNGTGTVTKLFIGSARGTIDFFNGSIDELQVWNKSFSYQEVTALYNSKITKHNLTRYELNYNSTTSVSNTNARLYVTDTLSSSSSTNELLFRRLYSSRVDSQSLVGTIYSLFYGTNNHGIWGSNLSWIDVSGDGVLDTVSNYSWHNNEYKNAKIKVFRADMSLNSISLSEGTFNDSAIFDNYANINTRRSLVKTAYENGQKVLFISDGAPSWLRNSTNGWCNSSRITSCAPSNYTKYGELVVGALNSFGCNAYSDTCMVEIINEPNSPTYWLNNITNRTNTTMINEYIKLYNETRRVILLSYPTMKIGGAGVNVGSSTYPYQNLLYSFIQNSSGFDILPIHFYMDSYIDSTLSNKVIEILGNCSTFSKQCNLFLNGEWNLRGLNINRNGSDSSGTLYSMQLSSSYTWWANNYPANVSNMLYQWQEFVSFDNSSVYPEYPTRWASVSEFGLDSRTSVKHYTPYNVTYQFARYAPASGTVYNTSIDNSEIVGVSTKIGTACNLIVTNTYNDYQNVSLSWDTSTCGSQMIDAETGTLYTNGSTIVQTPYDVTYLTRPYTVAGWDGYYNYLGEALTDINATTTTQLCLDTLSGFQEFGNFAVILIVVLVAGTLVFFLVGDSEGFDLDDATKYGVAIVVAAIAFGIGAVIIATLNPGC